MAQTLDLGGVIITDIPDTEDLNNASDTLKAFAKQSMETGEGSYQYQMAEEPVAQYPERTLDLDGMQIKNIPETEDLDNPSEELKTFARQAMETGESEYNYGDPVPVNLKNAAEQSIRQQEATKMEQTTAKGVLDSFVRNVAPALIATAISAPVGIAERVTHAITPAIAGFLNDKLNLTGTKWEQMSSQQMTDYIHDKLGLERADTPAEEVAGAAGTGVAEGMNMLNLSNVATATAPILGRGNLVQESGKALVDAPAREILSNTGAEAGATLGGNIAEENDMGTFGKIATPIVLGAAGSGFGVALDALTNRSTRKAVAKSLDMPEKAAEKIALGESRNTPVLTSDMIDPRTVSWNQMAKQVFGENLPLGTGNQRREQYIAVQDAIYDELSDFNLSKEIVQTPGYYDDKLFDNFIKVRGGKLFNELDTKKEIINRLSDVDSPLGPAVSTDKTARVIADVRADFVNMGNKEFNPILNQLTEWENVLENKDLIGIERQRKIIHDSIGNSDSALIQGGVESEVKSAVQDIYNSLNDDMGEYIKANGVETDFQDWKDSNKALAALSAEFNDVALADVIEQATKGNLNPDLVKPESIGTMLRSQDASDVQRLYNRVDEDGQAIMRTSIMHDIAFKASNKKGEMIPLEFAAELDNHLAQRGVLLDRNQRQSLVGLGEVIKFTGRAEEVMKGVGNSNVSGSLWRNIANLFTTGSTGISLGYMARLYETPKSRDLLVKLAEIPETRAGALQKSELAKRYIDLVKAYADPNKTEEETNAMMELQGEE